MLTFKVQIMNFVNIVAIWLVYMAWKVLRFLQNLAIDLEKAVPPGPEKILGNQPLLYDLRHKCCKIQIYFPLLK